MDLIKVKTIQELPDAVRDELRRLYLEDGMSPIIIMKQIEKNFGYQISGLHTLVTYLKSLKPDLAKEPELVLPDEENEEPKPTELAPFTGKATTIDVSSVKTQNETLKEIIKNKIEYLQNKSLSEEFDKDAEQILQRYILEFSKLTQNEVKIKDEFKFDKVKDRPFLDILSNNKTDLILSAINSFDLNSTKRLLELETHGYNNVRKGRAELVDALKDRIKKLSK